MINHDQTPDGLLVPRGQGIDPARLIQPEQKGVVHAKGFGEALLHLPPGADLPMAGGDFAAVVAPYQASTSAGSAIATTTTETDLFDVDPVFAINYFYPGRTIRIKMAASYQTAGTPTLTFRVRGGTGGVGGTLFATSGIVTTASGVASAQLLAIELWLQCWTTGSAGTATVWGRITAWASSGTTIAAAAEVSMPATNASTTFTLNTTVANTLAVTQQWNTSSASNTLTRAGYVVEALN